MRFARLASALAGLALALPAMAQVTPFNVERLRLDPSAIGSLVLPTGEVLPARNVRFAAALHYEQDPLVVADDGHVRGFGLVSNHDKEDGIVENRLTAHVNAAFGIVDGFEVGLELPIVAYQAGDFDEMDHGGIAAPWVTLRVGSPKPEAFAAGFSLGFSPGWGDQFDFAGNNGYSINPAVAASWRSGKHMVMTNLGLLVRSREVVLAGQEMQNEAQVGLGWSMESGALRYELTARGSFEASGRGEHAELLGGVRYKMGPADLFAIAGPGFMDLAGSPTFRALLGVAFNAGGAAPAAAAVPAPVAAVVAAVKAAVDPCAAGQKHTPEQCPALDDDGDGIANGDDACPTQEGIAEEKGCPAKDSDGDGIFDHEDKCPKVAGVAEEKGCPLPDSDGDGILDAQDKCPKQAGVPSEQGCPPARAQVNVETGKIDIKEKVYFDTGKATIQARSFKLLDDVAALLVASKGLTGIVIEGHTDNTGAADYNRTLSQQRADAVKTYLVGKGVAADRLEAKGYGPDQPAQPNTTRAGREANRRVEFTIKGIAK